MDRQEIATTVIAIAQTYNELAASITAKVSASMQLGEIDFDDFVNVHNTVIHPLIVQSAKITFDASITITDNLDQHFKFIQEGSNFLKGEIDKIEKVEKIITAAALILTTAALVAAFCVAPNIASGLAAAESLATLIANFTPEEGIGEATA